MLCSVLALIFCPGNKVCLCKWGWILFWPLHCSCVLEEGSWCGSSGSPHGAVLSSLPPSLLSPSDSEPLHVEETEDQAVPKATLLLFPGSLVQRLAIHMVLNCPPPKKKIFKAALLQSLFILVENYNFLAGSGFSAEWPEYP